MVDVSTDTMTVCPPVDDGSIPAPRELEQPRGRGDHVFSWMMSSSGLFVLATMSAVGLFLAVKSVPCVPPHRPQLLHHVAVAAEHR